MNAIELGAIVFGAIATAVSLKKAQTTKLNGAPLLMMMFFTIGFWSAIGAGVGYLAGLV